jgi:hypothetical protein
VPRFYTAFLEASAAYQIYVETKISSLPYQSVTRDRLSAYL